jgi:hypothetical protein
MELNPDQFEFSEDPGLKGYIKVYRGLSDMKPNDVSLNPVGVYWTTDWDVADGFTRFTWHPNHLEGQGTLIHAYVHPKDLAPSEANRKGVSHEEDWDKEVQVKKGAKIFVKHLEYKGNFTPINRWIDSSGEQK